MDGVKRLALLRHAKASWELAGQLDFERGLTERGVADCALVRELIAAKQIAPQLVLCSGARRARETLEQVAEALPPDATVTYDDAIYRADTRGLFEVLEGVGDEYDRVLLVGHNPSIHDFAVELAGGDEPIDELAGSFPTAALAEFEFEGAWRELASCAARLVTFVRPEDARSIR